MGEVYRAKDQHLEREVAIKVLHPQAIPDEKSRKLLHKEANALSKLNHPHIATIYDFDSQQGVDFLVMEYVRGQALSAKLTGGALCEREVAALGMQIAQALEEAHEQGIIHRDLKPANIAITAKGQVKVLDFGLAKLFDPARGELKAETLTQSVDDSHLIGTVPYMAPEQVSGEHVDARTDIYALGAALYEMATKQRPFREKSTPRLLASILHEPVVAPRALNPKISTELQRIILKCLEKEPGQRYQSAKELAIDLKRLGMPSAVVAPVSRRGFGVVAKIAVGAVGVGAAGLVIWALSSRDVRERLFGGTSRAPIHSLVVLPFTNLSGDPEQEYFADGITEELTSDLAKIGALRVISRTSAMRYKGTKKSSPEISREVNVDGIIEGSVQRFGSRVSITAQLIHGPSDTHRWANTYERDMGDILALRDEVARAIAREIKVTVTPQEQARLTVTHRVDPQSYELWLKGRYVWNKRTPEGLKKSIEYFQEAADKDPRNALAHAGLADSYMMLGAGDYGLMAPKDAMPKAEVAAKHALELDSALAEAHCTLGYLRFYFDWDWPGAETEFQEAIALNPSYATAHQWYALCLKNTGRFSEALVEMKKAESLDPLSLIISADVGWVLYHGRQEAQAIEQLRKTLEMDRNFVPAHRMLAHCYTQQKRYAEAIAEMKRAIQLAGDEPLLSEDLAYAYAMAGHRVEAKGILDKLNEESQHRFVPSTDMVFAYGALGDKDRAFYWLEKAYRAKEDIVVALTVLPELDSLREDARFQEIVRRVNLPHKTE